MMHAVLFGLLTIVVTVATLSPRLASALADMTDATALIEAPAGNCNPTCTTNVNTTGLSVESVGLVQLPMPVPPTVGVVHVQPEGALSETNVVFAGTLVVNCAL